VVRTWLLFLLILKGIDDDDKAFDLELAPLEHLTRSNMKSPYTKFDYCVFANMFTYLLLIEL
jgi:hypothetical protein